MGMCTPHRASFTVQYYMAHSLCGRRALIFQGFSVMLSTLLCPELGLGKILCAKRRRRGGNGQVKKTGLWHPRRGQGPWKYRPSPPCPEDRIFAFEGHREDGNSIGNSTDRYGVPRLPSKEGAGRRPHFLLGTFCPLAGTESRGAGLGESRSVLRNTWG